MSFVNQLTANSKTKDSGRASVPACLHLSQVANLNESISCLPKGKKKDQRFQLLYLLNPSRPGFVRSQAAGQTWSKVCKLKMVCAFFKQLGRKAKEGYFMRRENYMKLKFLSIKSFIGQLLCQLMM